MSLAVKNQQAEAKAAVSDQLSAFSKQPEPVKSNSQLLLKSAETCVIRGLGTYLHPNTKPGP